MKLYKVVVKKASRVWGERRDHEFLFELNAFAITKG